MADETRELARFLADELFQASEQWGMHHGLASTWIGASMVIEAMRERGFGFTMTVDGKSAMDMVAFGVNGGTVYVQSNGGRIETDNLP